MGIYKIELKGCQNQHIRILLIDSPNLQNRIERQLWGRVLHLQKYKPGIYKIELKATAPPTNKLAYKTYRIYKIELKVINDSIEIQRVVCESGIYKIELKAYPPTR